MKNRLQDQTASSKDNEGAIKGKRFPYYLEYSPNPDCIKVHARVRFPEGDSMDSIDLRFYNKHKKTFKGKKRDKRHPLFDALARIKGLKSASGGNYYLQVVKGNDLFTWPELLPKILNAVQKHVAGERKLFEIGQPRRPHPEYVASLRSQGCDL